jgi:hypothetical protein
MEFVKESALMGDSFVFWLGSPTGAQQWTFHRPVGVTQLDAKDWVATPTSELTYLLSRRSSEELAAWERQANLAKRKEVLASKVGRQVDDTTQTEVWVGVGLPAIGPTIKRCQELAKAATGKESEWLSHASPAVQVAETAFKEALGNQGTPDAWLGVNPKPSFETRGGPLGDRSQSAVTYLKGLSASSAKDTVLRQALGLAQPAKTPALPAAKAVKKTKPAAPTGDAGQTGTDAK